MFPIPPPRPAVVAASLFALLGVPALAGAQCNLDQQQGSLGSYIAIASPTFSWAQTFQLGLAGTLDEIRIYGGVTTLPSGSGPADVQIFPAVAGVPDETGPPLASLSIPFSRLPPPGSPDVFSVSLTQFEIAVQPGDRLAVELGVPSGSVFWNYNDTNPYHSGHLLQRPEPSGAWTALVPSSDGWIQTFVCQATGAEDGVIRADWGRVKAGYDR